MKKIILSAVAVLAFGFANAQETKFGVKAAVGMATLTGDVDGLGASSLVGFQIGGFAEIKLSEKFAVQPELLYSAQGTDTDFGKIELNYINIPVMAKYYVTKAISVEAGPQFGFLLTSKFDGEDTKDTSSSVDYGINLGAGYDFTDHISAGLRYNFGLANTTDDDSDDSTKNSVFSVSAAYKF